MIATVPKELKSNSRYKRNRGLKAMLIKSPFLTYLFQISQNRDKETMKNMQRIAHAYCQMCSGYRSHGQKGSVCIIPLNWLRSIAEVEEHVVLHTVQGISPRVNKVLQTTHTHSRIV